MMIESPPAITTNSNRLVELLHNTKVNTLIKEINNKYLYWDKVKYIQGPDGVSTEELWSAIKIIRGVNSVHLKFDSITSSFSLYITDYMQERLHWFDMNIGGYLESRSIIPEEDKHRYIVGSIMEEAIASSQMEGASTTRRQAKEMLRKEIKPKNRSEQMILNNYNTIKHIVGNKDDKLTPDRLLYIHKLIAYNTIENPEEEGKFRSSDDIFVVDHLNSEVVYTPPKSKEIDLWIAELCKFFNEDQSTPIFIHPIIRGIMIHFLIGYIHPFCDGNGRTARALFYWYMLKNEYWLTEYLSISRIIYKSKAKYEKAFLYTEIDKNDLSYFVQYNLIVMEQAFDSLLDYIRVKSKEQQQIVEYIKIDSINERQAIVLKQLHDKPLSVLTVKEIENKFAVSNQTARSDIMGLVDLGLVQAIAVNKKKYNYIRADNFEKIFANLIKR